MTFAYPWLIILILAIPFFLKQNQKKRMSAAIKFPTIAGIRKTRSKKAFFRKHLITLRAVALGLLIIAAARPQSAQHVEEIISQGIDIMLAIDVSGSMRAEDFKPNDRLAAAKYVVNDFIQGRKNDRIGITVFSGDSFTLCPLTLDYGILHDFVSRIEHGIVDKDGTAIGMAIANSINRLRRSDAQSKIIILLTDGENNAGKIEPLTAASLAKAMGVKIYTIAMGKKEGVPIPIIHPVFGKMYQRYADGSLVLTKVDEQTLQKIADTTGGKFFWAENEKKLKEIYSTIDSLEKTDIKTRNYTKYGELFFFPAFIAFALLLLETVCAQTILRKIP